MSRGLRIPMRGYEETHSHSFILIFTLLRIPMRGYEIADKAGYSGFARMLRIPMRGYEFFFQLAHYLNHCCYASP